jgi:hypothetical protein
MSISVKKYSPKHHEIAKAQKRVLFMWEMDKRYLEDANERIKIQCCGVMSQAKASAIWALINHRD